MDITVGQYFYEIGNSNTAGIDWSKPGRVTQYPAVDGNGATRPEWARVEWPGLLGLDQPLPVEQLHLVHGVIAADAQEAFEDPRVAA